MIDFHTHILPGIDDGSSDADTSIQMLYAEHKDGVNHIVFTPHFYADRDSIDHFLKCRMRSQELLMGEVEREPELSRLQYSFGAEVCYFGDIGKAKEVQKLCITGTDILLLEMPFCQWTETMYEDVAKLIQKQRLTVILAHVERYIDFQKKKGIWNRVFELPVISQMNAGPFLRMSGRRKALRLAEEMETVLLGSDAHNMTGRRPNMAEAGAVIEKKLGQQFMEKIDNMGQKLLGKVDT